MHQNKKTQNNQFWSTSDKSNTHIAQIKLMQQEAKREKNQLMLKTSYEGRRLRSFYENERKNEKNLPVIEELIPKGNERPVSETIKNYEHH